MKKYKALFILSAVFISLGFFISFAFINKPDDPGYVLQHEKDIAVNESGSHHGGGQSTAFSFFSKAPGLKFVFRKRILHPGSAIGYHLQKEDEIYYILSGTGEMKMNGKTFTVTAGDAILTRPGSWHGSRPAGNEDLALIINYLK